MSKLKLIGGAKRAAATGKKTTNPQAAPATKGELSRGLQPARLSRSPGPRGGRPKAKAAADHRLLAGATPPGAGRVMIKRIAVEAIKPAAYNPRDVLAPGDPRYEKLKRSLDDFGLVDPLIWNKRTGNLVGGHQRLTILVNEYGVKHVDVSVVDLPLAREKLLNIAMNKVGGDWDSGALGTMLAELELDESVDAAATGFDADEIETLILQSAAAGDEDGEADGEAPVRTGDSFKVVATCKDAAEQASVMATLKRKGIACHTLTRE